MFWDKISSLYDLFENIYNRFMSVFFNLFMVKTMKKLIFFLPFVFCIKVPALELTHTLTHLWSDSSGTALLYRWNVVEDFYAERYEFSSGASISLLDSTVHYCETSYVKGNFFADYKNRYFGLSGDFGFSFADSVAVSANHVYNQEGVSGINARISVPVYIEDAVIKPYFNFFTAESKKGDFYWFNGNVENPYTGQYGVQLLYKNHEVNGRLGTLVGQCSSRIRVVHFFSEISTVLCQLKISCIFCILLSIIKYRGIYRLLQFLQVCFLSTAGIHFYFRWIVIQFSLPIKMVRMM